MKPARFILNSDYATVRITGHKELSITIPDSFTVPPSPSGDRYIIGRVSTTIGDPKNSYSIYYSSSRYDYVTYGWTGATKPAGARAHSDIYGDEDTDIGFDIKIIGNTATFEASTANGHAEGDVHFTGFGQTITAHIITFKDPFSE